MEAARKRPTLRKIRKNAPFSCAKWNCQSVVNFGIMQKEKEGTAMRQFTIGKNDAGQRLDRWMSKTIPLLPAPLLQKYIRLKRVKLNGKGAKV